MPVNPINIGKNMNSKIKQERNASLDFLRGLCILGVLFHHTCLYNGGGFLPYLVEQSSFLLEVPALFFVSGLTYQYINRNMIIGNLTKLSLVFTLTAFLIGLYTKSLSLGMVLKPLFLSGLDVPGAFHVLGGSYWFVSVYVSTLIFSTIVISRFRPLYPLILLLCLITFVIDFFKWIDIPEIVIHGWPVKRVTMHIIFFLFGFLSGEHLLTSRYKNIFIFVLSLTVIATLTIIYRHSSWAATNLHKHKDAWDFVYMSASFISVIVLLLLYRVQVKNAFVEHIGQYSIYYFAGQGVSSSYIAGMAPHIHYNPYLKILALFALNLVMMLFFSEILRFIYEKIGWCYNKAVARYSLKPDAA